MKDLLRITQLDGDVCEVFANISDSEEGSILASNLLALLTSGPTSVKAAIMTAVLAFVKTDPDELEKLVEGSILPVPNTQHAS